MATVTEFYDWDGDACRLHRHDNGDVTADLYRPGRGPIPVSAGDVDWEGVQISEPAYHRLVALNNEVEGAKKER